MFYANEHDPVHVHGKCQGRETKAEIILLDGAVIGIRYIEVAGREPLSLRETRHFKQIINARSQEIVQKWIDFFVLQKPIKPERITEQLK